MEIYQENTLRDYLRVLFRHKLVVVTSIITVIVTVIIGLIFKTPVYEAQVKLLISAQKQVESPYYQEIAGYRDMQLTLTQSEIVKSNAVIGLAVKALGLYQRPLDYEKNFSSLIKKPLIISSAALMNFKLRKLTEDQKRDVLYRAALQDLKQNVKVEPIRDTNLFVISVTDYSPLGAAIMANAISRSYTIFDLQQQLAELQLKYGEKHPTSIQLKENIEKMTKSLSGEPLSDVEAIGSASVKIIEQASIPSSPQGLPKIITLALAVFMSIFLGVMLAFVFEYMDQTFKSPKEVESFLGIPYLGAIPKNPKISVYHDLADQIYLLMRDKKLKTLLFASALANEGVTTTINNLGAYFSKRAGHRVLIIDANLRSPAMQKLDKVLENQGLIDVLEEKISFDKAVKDLGNNLFVLAAGKTELNPVTLLGSHMMQDVIKQAKEKYQIVMIDSAALSIYKDSAMLAGCGVDGIIIVVNESKTRKQVVQVALNSLEQNKASVLGAVLNNRTFVIPKAIYDRF